MLQLIRHCVFFIASLLAMQAHAADWRMMDGSSLAFEATFEGASAPGRFRKFDVEFRFDAAAPRKRTSGSDGLSGRR